MKPKQQAGAKFRDCLRTFLQHADAVWQAYQAEGPGKVAVELFEPAETAAAALDEFLTQGDVIEATAALRSDIAVDPASLRQAIQTVRDLTGRCALRSEGLCFITGEAGLIPRRDLHAALESSLEMLRSYCN